MSTAYNQNVSASGIASNSNFASDIDSYGSFSGANITAFVNHAPVGTLMGISYTIHSEKQAQYTMGSPNVRRFASGKRGIAGTLVFNTFDRAALIAIFNGSNLSGAQLLTNTPGYNGSSNQQGNNNGPAAFSEIIPGLGSLNPQNGVYNTQVGNTLYDNGNAPLLTNAYTNAFLAPLDYTDQLPPFDVTLSMVDNQGAAAYMAIIGIEIMNEGGGFTVDDMVNQTAYTYVARGIRPLTPVASNGVVLINPILAPVN